LPRDYEGLPRHPHSHAGPTPRYAPPHTPWKRTEWHSLTLWGKRGEALAKFLKKGDRLFIEGGLRTSSYEKDGEKRYRTEIIVSNVILNGGRGKQDGGDDRGEGRERGTSRSGGDRPHTPAPAPAPAAGDDYGEDYGDDDGEIPF
jgi:single-strand DNA-binding protein